MKISDADAVRLGGSSVSAVYSGSTKVWPSGDADSLAFIERVGLDGDQGAILTSLVAGLKSANIWSKCQAIWPLIGGTADAHSVNLKSIGTFDITWNGDGVHSATGYQPGGNANNFGDTHYVPNDSAIIDDCHLTMYSRSQTMNGAQCDYGSYDPTLVLRFHLIVRYDGDLLYPGLAEKGSAHSDTPSTDSRGFFVTSRSDLEQEHPYRNGTPFGAVMNVNADSLPTQSMYIGRLNDFPPGPSQREFAFATVGRSLTDQNVADLYDIVQAYQTALGRQV